MRKLNLVLMVVLTLGVIGGAAYLSMGVGAPAADDGKEVEYLLRKLGDLDPELRREAEARLRSMGPEAMPILEKAATSDDARLSRRAKKLLGELKPASVVKKPEPGTEPPRPDVPEAPPADVRFVIECPDTRASSPEEARFYVRLVNDRPVPVLLLRDRRTGYARLAGFELRDEADRVVVAATRPGASDAAAEPELVAVPPGETYDLFAGQADGRAGLHGVIGVQGLFRIRFYYDASEGSAYRLATEGASEGAPLPPERMVSNEIAIRLGE